MNPLQVTNLCSTRRGTLWSAAAAKAIQIEAGDHRLQLPQAHFDCDCDGGSDCGFSGSSLRSCCTFHRRQSAGLLWQQMPVAQMLDIKGKSSASCDSTCFDSLRLAATLLLPRSEIEASVEALWHHVASTKYPIYIYI